MFGRVRRPEASLDDLLSKRVVLVTGKGGVGRSSVTAAIAAVAARRKKRVLVTELGDTGGNESHLARIYGRERLPDLPEDVAPGIRGCLLLSTTGQEHFLRSVLPVGALARAALQSEALRRLLGAAPSFREMGIFQHLLSLLRLEQRSGGAEHELVLIDMPATGHTLALTGLPDILLRLVPTGPIADRLREGQTYLNDPKKGAAYVVTLPETLPVSETLELLDGLAKTSMPRGGVILNKMPRDPFTPEERELLKPIVEKRRLYGAEGFHRAAEADRALARLRQGVDLDVWVIPECMQGPGLISSMADALDGAKPLRREAAAVARKAGS